MNKAQKKQTILKLLNEVQQTTDSVVAEQKLEAIINEIYSAGFDLQRLKVVSKVINTFITDIPENALSTSNSEFRIETSKTALLTLIDLSKLPD